MEFLRVVKSDALDDGEDVALAVLEPGGLRAAAGIDAVPALHPWHVVLLELHAAGLELSHLAFDIVDLPERLARLGRAGVRRWIEEASRALAELVDHAARHLLLGLEAELALVELAGALDVLRRYIGVHVRVLQHGALLRPVVRQECCSSPARPPPW